MNFEEKRISDIESLEKLFNETLEIYLDNYEKYLMYRSSNVYNSKSVADSQYKPNVIKYNKKLLDIVKQLYTDTLNSEHEYGNTKKKNDKKRKLIEQNITELENQLKILSDNNDTLITNIEKLNEIQIMNKRKNLIYKSLLITDIVVGIILMLIFILSLRR